MKVGVYLERRHDVTWTTRVLGISETTEGLEHTSLQHKGWLWQGQDKYTHREVVTKTQKPWERLRGELMFASFS